MTTGERYMKVDGIDVRVRDSGGEGPSALLIHGIGESLEFWHPQFTALGQTLRLIALDLPGHGESALGKQPYDPDSFAVFGWRLVDAIGLTRVHLVGNSLGGAIAIRMAGMAPQRTHGLVAADAACIGPGVFFPFRLMSLPLLGEIMNKPSPQAVDRQIAAIVADRSSVDAELRRAIERNLSREDAIKPFLTTLRTMTSLRGQRPALWQRTRAILTSLTMPVHFVHGRKDVVVPKAHSAQAQKLTPGSELTIFDCGHTPQIERPEQFNELLAKAMSERDGRRQVSTAMRGAQPR